MSNKLVSTRDEGAERCGYNDALLAGLAPDNGLYTPEEVPVVDEAMLTRLRDMPYTELYTTVKAMFIGDDIAADDQKRLAEAAFTPEKFVATRSGNYMPVHEIQEGFYMQNLSLGPTAAFKDAALQPLAQEMNHVLTERDEQLRLLGATSGDTGSAAEAAFKGLGRLSLFMLSPDEGMSRFQQAQMGELSGDNIFNISVRGRFDDCQDMVKETKADPEFADIGAVNSINWGRISSQIPYYFSGYLQVQGDQIGEPLDVVVPSGNFGNILAAYFAREMGLPLRRLIVATNENDVLNRLIQTGEYKRKPAEVTSSPSMDISKASNYERLVYYLMNGDPEATASYMKAFEKDGEVSFSDFSLPNNVLKQLGFESGTSTHDDRLEAIRWTRDVSNMIIDPHTADAVKVAYEFVDRDVPIMGMATALPVKFEDTIDEALGFTPDRPEQFVGLEDRAAEGFTVIDQDTDQLKNFIRDNSA